MEDRFRFRAWNKIREIYEYNVQECIKISFSKTAKVKCFACFQNYLNHQEDFEIEQCTGLRDKNGKLIYEGDIVEVPMLYNDIPTGKKQRCKVYYKHGGFNIYAVKSEYLKAIGNIHENSELLEGNK